LNHAEPEAPSLSHQAGRWRVAVLRFVQRSESAGNRRRKPDVQLAVLVLLAGCATGPTPTAKPEPAPSHVYPLPLDNVLAQAETLLAQQGWQVQRSGNVLVTNWLDRDPEPPQGTQAQGLTAAAALVGYRVSVAPGSRIGYRVFGERIDAGFCTLRVERLVATPSTLDFGQKKGGHQTEQTTTPGARAPTPVHNENRTLMSAFEYEDDLPAESKVTGVPSGMVVSQHERDEALELAFQQQIDPVVALAAKPADAVVVAVPANALADAGVSPQPQPTLNPERHPDSAIRPTALAGVWTGNFTFRGKVTGSFSGEVAISVDGDSVEVADFCPENGGTMTLQGSDNTASWQGAVSCPAIRLSGCPAATFTYNSANAMLNDGTLTVIAAGAVSTRCLDSGGEFNVGGALSVVFVAEKADYIHIAVTKAKRATTCVWPSDWEDFASKGSMAMPEPQADDAAYLGIIRAKGARLSEIQRLLRHCRQVVLLHGQPVLMRLAVTRTQTSPAK
jgi:hypothetical protein